MKYKILLVTGQDDFAAVAFENHYKGQKVADIIPNLDIENGEDIETYEDEFCTLQYGLVEIETSDIEQFKRLFTKIATDRKHKNFYIDTQVL